MYNNMTRRLMCPTIHKQSEVKFWDDEHISKQMLNAHLDPEYEGASRKLKFIEQSVKWIRETVPPQQYPKLLDVGCGPGLYAEQFCRAGYQVTGIDFSKRSIVHAQDSARRQGLVIDYLYQNYLQMNASDTFEAFDLAMLIYCDYGALSPEDRSLLLRNVYRSLKKGGRFLLDVFSLAKYEEFQEEKTWEDCPKGGFWRAEKHLVLNGHYRYGDDVTLEQIVVMTGGDIQTYYLWTSYFTKETLIQEVQKSGFKVVGLFDDVAGQTAAESSPTIAILLEK